jgi:hypothetical protein
MSLPCVNQGAQPRPLKVKVDLVEPIPCHLLSARGTTHADGGIVTLAAPIHARYQYMIGVLRWRSDWRNHASCKVAEYCAFTFKELG